MDPSELKLLIDKALKYIKHFNQKKNSFLSRRKYKFARSSIVADRDIKKGQKIVQKDIWARRPGNGEIAGYEYAKVLGMTAKVDIVKK